MKGKKNKYLYRARDNYFFSSSIFYEEEMIIFIKGKKINKFLISTITIDTNIGAEIGLGWFFFCFVANNQFKIELRKWIVKHAAATKLSQTSKMRGRERE